MSEIRLGVSLEILGGICNSADLCKKRKCLYRKLSREATKKYLKLLAEKSLGRQVEENQPPEYCPMKNTIIWE